MTVRVLARTEQRHLAAQAAVVLTPQITGLVEEPARQIRLEHVDTHPTDATA